MSDDQTRFLFDSKFDDRVTILIVYPEDPQYSEISGMFEKRGHAFFYHQEKMIVMDGAAISQSWFTEDHLDVIHAHELGHFYANHISGSDEDERQADWIGIQILRYHIKKGTVNNAAVDLHLDEFMERYGIDAHELDEHYQDLFSGNLEISKFLNKKIKSELSEFIVRQWKNNFN